MLPNREDSSSQLSALGVAVDHKVVMHVVLGGPRAQPSSQVQSSTETDGTDLGLAAL